MKSRFIIPEGMDKECIELCTVLNKLPEVTTTESCCGHLKSQYIVFFRCADFVRLAKLYRCVDRNYSDGKWEILVSGSDSNPVYGFLLRSKVPFTTYEEMQDSISGLISNITYWESPEFNEYFNSNNG